MYGRGCENWTQGSAAPGEARGLQTLLRLARENETALRADLKEVTAARNAASNSLNGAGEGDPSEGRRQALRRLLDNLERSEASIRDKLAEIRTEAGTLETLIERTVFKAGRRGASLRSPAARAF